MRGRRCCCSTGQALTFVAGHADLQTTLAERLQLTGWALSAAALLPALGALYRSAVGGEPKKGIGWGGLQVGRAESSILGVFAACAVCLFLLLVSLSAAAAAIRVPLKDAGVVRLPAIGPFALWVLCAVPLLIGLAASGHVALSRLSLAQPAAVAEGRLHLGKAVHASRRWPASLAATLAVVELLPIVLLIGLARGLEALEHGWIQAAGLSAWPLLDAWVAGSVLALLTSFVLLPLKVGAGTHFYGCALAESRAAERRRASIEPMLLLVDARAKSAEIDAAEEPVAAVIVVEPKPFEALAPTRGGTYGRARRAGERCGRTGPERLRGSGGRQWIDPTGNALAGK